jgi:spermidine synthase
MPALLLLFIGSGCAALIYEVVWFQLLQLSVGSSAVSLGILLGVFMGGMCLGSLLLPRRINPSHHPLRVYAVLELGIGLFGILVLFGVPLIGDLYTRIAGTGQASLFLRAIVASICLLPPTLLMGATLPAVARWVETTPAGVSWLGYFYGGNLAGAVAGSLIAGFYLLRLYDMPTATYAAVAINVIVAVLALAIARVTPYEQKTSAMDTPVSVPEARLVYVTIALSGLTALGAEVVWTRILSLIFGATTYTFSLILAVFLVGLGIGSTIGSELARRVSNPRAALGWCQLLLCVTIAWAAYSTGNSLPYWPINPSISTSPWFNVQLDLMRAIWVMLPAAMLWGASFPLALAAVAARGQDPGRLVGGVYAANTVGAIVGALVTSLVLVGTFGSQVAQQVLIGIAAISGLLVLVPEGRTEGNPGLKMRTAVILVIVVCGAAVLLARTVPPLPGLLVAYGRYSATWVGINQIVYVGEGVTAAVAVSRTPEGVLNYHNAGKVQASSEPQDMRLQRMLGHITTLVPEHPTKVLVIGCGAGVTAGAVSIDPLVKDQTIAEIEPLVPRVVSTHFAEHNFNVVRNPKVRIHLDDARHYLLTTDEKFDAITSDPLDPWVKGAATLYTREFFNVVREHLNPDGVVTLFVQLYESNEDAVKSEIATFLEAFPNGAVFANTINGQGYDLVLFGQVSDKRINVDAIQARLDRPDNDPIKRSLQQIGIDSAMELFSTYAGSRTDLADWLKDAQINTDRNLRLQYLAGMGFNLYQSAAIYRSMIGQSRYPEKMFEGSPETLERLRAEIGRNLGQSRPQS